MACACCDNRGGLLGTRGKDPSRMNLFTPCGATPRPPTLPHPDDYEACTSDLSRAVFWTWRNFLDNSTVVHALVKRSCSGGGGCKGVLDASHCDGGERRAIDSSVRVSTRHKTHIEFHPFGNPYHNRALHRYPNWISLRTRHGKRSKRRCCNVYPSNVQRSACHIARPSKFHRRATPAQRFLGVKQPVGITGYLTETLKCIPTGAAKLRDQGATSLACFIASQFPHIKREVSAGAEGG